MLKTASRRTGRIVSRMGADNLSENCRNGSLAQRQSCRLITGWFQVRPLDDPPIDSCILRLLSYKPQPVRSGSFAKGKSSGAIPAGHTRKISVMVTQQSRKLTWGASPLGVRVLYLPPCVCRHLESGWAVLLVPGEKEEHQSG